MSSPHISKELLDYLQRLFPNTLPQCVPGIDQMGRLIGQQDVVRHLKAQFDAQNKTLLRTS